MDVAAKVTSKGQVTVPRLVRDALGIKEGDQIVFRVEGTQAVLARKPDFLDLAGTVKVPAAKRNAAWDHVIRTTRATRAADRRWAHSSIQTSSPATSLSTRRTWRPERLRISE